MNVKSSIHRPKVLLIATLTMFALTIFGALLVSYLIINGNIPENYKKIVGRLVAGVSSLIGCMIAGKNLDAKAAVYQALVCAAYVIILSILGLIISKSNFQIGWGSILSVVISYVVGCAFCIRNKKTRKIPKIRN